MATFSATNNNKPTKATSPAKVDMRLEMVLGGGYVTVAPTLNPATQ